jgi:hypothetical protein
MPSRKNDFWILRVILMTALFGGSSSGPEVIAAPPTSIRGRVTASRKPLEGAYVGLHRIGAEATTFVMTDHDGRFAFRAIPPGTYTVFTQIPAYRKLRRDGITGTQGKETVVDFQVEPENDFWELIEQASNAELTESFPISAAEREALDYRCGDCHGVYYIAKSRFNLKDWQLIVAAMDDQRKITPAADISPPSRMSRPSQRDSKDGPKGSDDEAIVNLLARFRSDESPNFPIKFRPRATGALTRAIVTEYEIPRVGATPRTVVVEPNGRYVWYSDWRANYLGRIDKTSGEIKEYAIPGRDDRPPGLQRIGWDPFGNLWAGQIWSGRAIRFDTKAERVSGVFAPPQEWVRAGAVDICSRPDGSVAYSLTDALVGTRWTLNPEEGKFSEVPRNPGDSAAPCIEQSNWSNNSGRGSQGRSIGYRNPDTGESRVFVSLSPWSRPYNVVGDPAHKIGWTAPDVTDRIVKADLKTGSVTEYPLPSHGKEIRNIDIDNTVSPPTLWFVNQRLGRIVRFQEYAE